MGMNIKVPSVVTALLMSLATSALAAQPVNRAGAANGGGPVNGGVNATRFVQGRVVAVQPAGGGGLLQVRPTSSLNNAARMNGAAGALATQTFAVGPSTQFQVSQGANWRPASAAMLRPGQRVVVQAQGQQAVGVRIVMRKNYSGRGRVGYFSTPRVRGITPNRAATIRPPSTTASARVAHHHHVSVPRSAGRATKR